MIFAPPLICTKERRDCNFYSRSFFSWSPKIELTVFCYINQRVVIFSLHIKQKVPNSSWINMQPIWTRLQIKSANRSRGNINSQRKHHFTEAKGPRFWNRFKCNTSGPIRIPFFSTARKKNYKHVRETIWALRRCLVRRKILLMNSFSEDYFLIKRVNDNSFLFGLLEID